MNKEKLKLFLLLIVLLFFLFALSCSLNDKKSDNTINNIDNQPPTSPTNLIASTISSSKIYLSWNASTDNVEVVGYYIYRNGTQINHGRNINTNFTDSSLIPNTQYSYIVKAFDDKGNVSTDSNQVIATTLEDINSDQLYKNGKQFFDDKKYDLALQEFTKFIQFFPKDRNIPYALFYQAECNRYLNDLDKALELYKDIIKNYPNYADISRKSYFAISNIYMQKEDYESAFNGYVYITINFSLTDEGIESLMYIGDIYYIRKDFKNAAESYYKVSTKFPSSKFVPLAFFKEADSYFQDNNFKSAISTYKFLIEKIPDWERLDEGYLNLGIAYYKNNDFNLAKETFNATIQLYPDSKSAVKAQTWLLLLP